MRTFKNYMEAAKAKKLEETGEEGFSLIELIIVVVILGILAAIAIPIFLNIQGTANVNALKAIAANGATQTAAKLASGGTAAKDDTLANLSKDGVTVTITKLTGSDIDTICVSAAKANVTTQTSGPGC